jgi:phage baseplate assembly protein gpV
MRFPAIVAAVVVAAAAISGQAISAQATKPAKTTSHHEAVAGKLQSYDASSKVLKVQTSKGEQQFTVANDAVVRQGAKKLTADDLASHSGQNVKVRYTESNGQKMADSITVAGGPAQSASTKKKTRS